MRVLFLVPGDINSASTRYRVLNCLPHLAEKGINYEVISLKKWRRTSLPNAIIYPILLIYIIVQSTNSNCMFIHRIRFPSWFMKLLSIKNKIIYDFDDAIYTGPSWKEVDSKKTQRFYSMITYADTIIAGSQTLLDQVCGVQDNTHVLPTAIPKDKYSNIESSSDDGKIVLGWIGNTENLTYLSLIEKEVTKILKNHDNVELHIISGERPKNMFEDRYSKDVVYKEWELENEIQYLSQVDIGLRPLPDNEWTRGKGGYTSVVQFLSLGIPVLVSPVGYLKEMIINGESGFLIQDYSEWSDRIAYLVENREARRDIGNKGQKILDEEGLYTHQYVDTLEKIIKSTCDKA